MCSEHSRALYRSEIKHIDGVLLKKYCKNRQQSVLHILVLKQLKIRQFFSLSGSV